MTVTLESGDGVKPRPVPGPASQQLRRDDADGEWWLLLAWSVRGRRRGSVAVECLCFTVLIWVLAD